MRKTIHHLLSFMLMLAVLVSTTSWFSLPVFAADSDTELDTYVSYDTVKPYIDQSSTRETVQIGNDLVTYYRGNGFVVVSEANGYALITINDNTGEIRLMVFQFVLLNHLKIIFRHLQSMHIGRSLVIKIMTLVLVELPQPLQPE